MKNPAMCRVFLCLEFVPLRSPHRQSPPPFGGGYKPKAGRNPALT